jgi:RNA polymerase sigma factor (sigma-70 family)
VRDPRDPYKRIALEQREWMSRLSETCEERIRDNATSAAAAGGHTAHAVRGTNAQQPMDTETDPGRPAESRALAAALAELHPDCFGWALGCCAWNREEAEDVLQTVYLEILDGRARFAGRSSVKTWLFAVIRHTAARRRRRQWLLDLLPERLVRREPPPQDVADLESLALTAETSRELRAALLKLPERQRHALHLVFYEDLSVDEAAALLGISVGSARTHYHRGKERLRQLLGRTKE